MVANSCNSLEEALSIALMFLSDQLVLQCAEVSRTWRQLVGESANGKVRSIRIECLRRLRSQPPWFVDLKNGKDENEGSSKQPFKTVHRANQMMQIFMKNAWGRRKNCDSRNYSFVRCYPGICALRTCNSRGCNLRVCIEHGEGRVQWLETSDAHYEFLSTTTKSCVMNGCKVALCSRHSFDKKQKSQRKANRCDGNLNLVKNNKPPCAGFDPFGSPIFCVQHLLFINS